MITINDNLKESPWELINPQGSVIGSIDNVLIFNDVRVQIKRKGAWGYSVRKGDVTLVIDKDGRIDNWPKDLFPLIETQLMELVGFTE